MSPATAVTRDDLQAFVAYRLDPDVARYQSWDPTYHMTDAEALLAAQADAGFGTPGAWPLVAALDRPSGELVGDCAAHALAHQPGTAEVGITLARARGRGWRQRPSARSSAPSTTTTRWARCGGLS